jgi:hypothetical protein
MSASFDTNTSHVFTIVHDPEKHDFPLKVNWLKHIFLTFVMYTTHIRVTFVQNVKKVKNLPTLLLSPSVLEGMSKTFCYLVN